MDEVRHGQSASAEVKFLVKVVSVVACRAITKQGCLVESASITRPVADHMWGEVRPRKGLLRSWGKMADYELS